MASRILSGKIFFPAGSVIDLEEDVTLEVYFDAENNAVTLLINGEMVYPEGE